MNDVRLLSLKQVAEILGVSYSTALAYAKAEVIPTYKLPSINKDGLRRKIQVMSDDLDAFLAGHKSGHNNEIEPLKMAINTHGQKSAKKNRKRGNTNWQNEF